MVSKVFGNCVAVVDRELLMMFLGLLVQVVLIIC